MGFGIRDSGFASANPDPPERIPHPKSRIPSGLYAILDHDVAARAGWSLPDLASAFLDGGARFLQVRAKSLPSGQFLDLAAAVVERAAGSGALVVINDRADVAVLARAGGVHVGQEDLAPRLVRRLVGDEAVVGVSTHTAEQIDGALAEPISYLAIGPVFGSQTKATGYDAVGLARVAAAAKAAAEREVPVVAIGGITLENAASVIRAGAHSVAVIGDLLADTDPSARVRAFLVRLASLEP